MKEKAMEISTQCVDNSNILNALSSKSSMMLSLTYYKIVKSQVKELGGISWKLYMAQVIKIRLF